MKHLLALAALTIAPLARADYAEDRVERGKEYQIQRRFQTGERARPMNYLRAGVSHEAFAYLKQCQETFGKYMGDRGQVIQNIVLADFSDCLEQPRLYVIKFNNSDPEKSTVELKTWVSHGTGSGRKDPSQNKWACTTAKKLSDGKATQQTPAGCMRMFGQGAAGFMQTYPRLRGFYVSGLEKMNECAYTKGIRLHDYPKFTNPSEIASPAKDGDTHEASGVSVSTACMRVDAREIENLKPHVHSQGGTLLVNYPGAAAPGRRQIEARPGLENHIGNAMGFEASGNRKRNCVQNERATEVTVIPNQRTVMRNWFTGTTVHPERASGSRR